MLARSREAFVTAMGAAVSGVTVVTTIGERGPIGRTISAMASVSADPPLLLVCVRRGSPLRTALLDRGSFAVNVLGVQHASLADVFAGRAVAAGAAPFAEPAWSVAGPTGAPVLRGAPATFECVVASASEAGSHTVFLGAVLDSRVGDAEPLAYSRRRYVRPAPLAA